MEAAGAMKWLCCPGSSGQPQDRVACGPNLNALWPPGSASPGRWLRWEVEHLSLSTWAVKAKQLLVDLFRGLYSCVCALAQWVMGAQLCLGRE